PNFQRCCTISSGFAADAVVAAVDAVVAAVDAVIAAIDASPRRLLSPATPIVRSLGWVRSIRPGRSMRRARAAEIYIFVWIYATVRMNRRTASAHSAGR